MKINIKDDAQAYLADKIPAGSQVILTTDDGSNKYSSLGGSCAIGPDDKDKLTTKAVQDTIDEHAKRKENKAADKKDAHK